MRSQQEAREAAAHRGIPARDSTDYAGWSFEELRQLATQLRLPDAATKNRRELLEIFAGAD